MPLDSSVASEPIAPAAVPPAPLHWNPFLRAAFRFCFCYLTLWILLNGNATIWDAIPWIGSQLGQWAALIPVSLANWLAPHVFHLSGIAAHSHPTGSGDTAIHWIVTGIFAVAALFATLVWTVLDRRRREYQTLLAWLRFALRLSIGASLLGYGFYKLFPLQMPALSLARLNEPVGQLSPMALLWTFLGASPAYEMVCGFAEIAAAVLLLVRRTALLGALVTAFVAANIVLYNFLFDVPVKLFSLHLLLGALLVALPDARALYSFFFLHIPAAPGGVWVPPAERRGFRRATLILEAGFLALVLVQSAFSAALGYRAQSASGRLHSPLQGAWEVKDSQISLTSSAITQVYVERGVGPATFSVVARSQNGEPAWGSLDTEKHLLHLSARSGYLNVAYQENGPNRIEIVAPAQGKEQHSVLVRMPQPDRWPLLTRGFHLVSEYPYQR